MTARTAQLLLERIAQLEAALLDAQTIAENHHTRALAAEAEVRALREVEHAARILRQQEDAHETRHGRSEASLTRVTAAAHRLDIALDAARNPSAIDLALDAARRSG